MAMLEAAVELVKALIDGGPAALWEKIKEYLGNLKEMIVDAIQEWVVTSVIKAAVTKLATMFNPVGAIIQAIITIYNTVMFFIERINQIIDFVEAVINSVHQIATGAIDSAANWIEKAMARTIPLIISFLARLLGLGGITEKIKGFILKVQTKVDQALDKVIDKIIGGIKNLFAKGKAAAGKIAAKVVEWWKERVSFKNEAGESHELSIEGTETDPRMIIASTPTAVEVYLNSFTDTQKATAEWKAAKTAYDNAKRIVYTFRKPNAAEGEERKKIIKNQLAQVSAAFAKLAGGAPTAADYPKTTKPNYSGPPPTDNSVEYIVGNAKIDSKPKKGANTGTPGWKKVFDAGLTLQSDKWVQMHVISEQLGGKAQPNNLISAPGSVNTGYFRSFEFAAKNLAKASSGRPAIKNVVWVNVKVTWRDADFANNITGTAGLYFWKGKKANPPWVKDEKPAVSASATVPKPDFHEHGKVSLNYSSKTDLLTVIKDSALAEIIKTNRPYADEAEFRIRVEGAAEVRGISQYKNKINGVLSNKRVVLHDVVPP